MSCQPAGSWDAGGEERLVPSAVTAYQVLASIEFTKLKRQRLRISASSRIASRPTCVLWGGAQAVITNGFSMQLLEVFFCSRGTSRSLTLDFRISQLDLQRLQAKLLSSKPRAVETRHNPYEYENPSNPCLQATVKIGCSPESLPHARTPQD